MHQPCVYIITNKPYGVLYVGLTSHLTQRIWQHKQSSVPSFSQQYNLHMLVYYELCVDMYSAISREKQLKRWRRAWKINLINEHNPEWQDLYLSLFN